MPDYDNDEYRYEWAVFTPSRTSKYNFLYDVYYRGHNVSYWTESSSQPYVQFDFNGYRIDPETTTTTPTTEEISMPDTDTEEVLPSFAEVNVRDAYITFSRGCVSGYSSTSSLRRGFSRYLARNVSDPELVTDIVWCARCTYPTHLRESFKRGTNRVCSVCAPYYVNCGTCDRIEYASYMYDVSRSVEAPDSGRACAVCINKNYRYCAVCGFYDRKTNDDAHDHENNHCCASPQVEFKVPNGSGKFLANDKRVTVTLPAGEISEEGLLQIKSKVRAQEYGTDDLAEQNAWAWVARNLYQLGNMWQTKEGNYPKRLSRFAYKNHKLKVPATLMTQIGNIARDHSTAVNFKIAVTRELNQRAYKFAHAESCWWSSYSNSRCALKTNGGFAIRTFNKHETSGRAWVMPLRKNRYNNLVPTFNTESPDAYMVFNGYGTLSNYVPARILSHMTGMTYRKVELATEPMYVNGGSGYLVGPEEIITPYTDGTLQLGRLAKHADLFETENKELVNA